MAIDKRAPTSSTFKKDGGKEKNAAITARRHPEYSGMINVWDFFLQSYIGGEDYIRANLFKYFKEGVEEFAARIARSYRENHSRRVVDLINSYLFKEMPQRDYESPILEKFIKNADGKGNSLTHFMKSSSQFSAALGRIYIVIDKKSTPEDERTGTQADNLKVTPYCYIVYPQDMLDIAIDDFGNVKWALVREKARDGDDNFYTASETLKERYRLWEKGKWTLFNEDGEQIDSGSTDIDVVPIVVLDNEERSVYSGQSLIADIAYLDRAIFNNWSRLDTIVCDQTFSQLIFPIEGLLTEVAGDEELREQFMTLATNRVLLYSVQAGNPPAFISPDASQAQFILDMIQVQVKQLYASLGLQGEIATEAKRETGVAKAYDFDKLNKLLANKADNLEAAEERIFKIVKKWMGGISIEVIISYPDEFDTKSLVDELNITERVALLEIYNRLNRELGKNIAQKALPHAKKTIIEEINKEIDTLPDRITEESLLGEPFDSRPPTSPKSKDKVSNPKRPDYPTPTKQQSKEKVDKNKPQ